MSVNLNWKIKKQKSFLFAKRNFPPDERHPGPRSRYGKYGPRPGYGFLRTACQPIRIEIFKSQIITHCIVFIRLLDLGMFKRITRVRKKKKSEKEEGKKGTRTAKIHQNLAKPKRFGWIYLAC